ncbi:MAG: hypothetical protein CSA32_04650 [Desulfobulbus propionicus]|nr:MAG: hypothetical protein CSA32_04650 [Desulfobulbus propionicus]
MSCEELCAAHLFLKQLSAVTASYFDVCRIRGEHDEQSGLKQVQTQSKRNQGGRYPVSGYLKTWSQCR